MYFKGIYSWADSDDLHSELLGMICMQEATDNDSDKIAQDFMISLTLY